MVTLEQIVKVRIRMNGILRNRYVSPPDRFTNRNGRIKVFCSQCKDGVLRSASSHFCSAWLGEWSGQNNSLAPMRDDKGGLFVQL